MSELLIPKRFNGTQYRTATVEHVDLDEGTILLKAAPYDVETRLDQELFESFAPKCFERAANAPSRCKMWFEHGGPLIGHASEVEDRPDGVWIRSRFSNTVSAQEARELSRDGTLTDCSVTFKPMADHMKVTRKPDGLHVRHSRAALFGVALVAMGQYAEHAYVASVRDSQTDRAREQAMARLRSLSH